jgi:hypothetical protein
MPKQSPHPKVVPFMERVSDPNSQTAEAHDALRALTPWERTPKCQGTRTDGGKCGAFAGHDGFCFQHSPNRSDAEKHAVRSAGGVAAKQAKKAYKKIVPSRLRAVMRHLDDAIVDLRSGKLAPRVASAMASLANAQVAVIREGEIEERLRAMEHALAADEAAADYGAQFEDE